MPLSTLFTRRLRHLGDLTAIPPEAQLAAAPKNGRGNSNRCAIWLCLYLKLRGPFGQDSARLSTLFRPRPRPCNISDTWHQAGGTACGRAEIRPGKYLIGALPMLTTKSAIVASRKGSVGFVRHSPVPNIDAATPHCCTAGPPRWPHRQLRILGIRKQPLRLQLISRTRSKEVAQTHYHF